MIFLNQANLAGDLNYFSQLLLSFHDTNLLVFSVLRASWLLECISSFGREIKPYYHSCQYSLHYFVNFRLNLFKGLFFKSISLLPSSLVILVFNLRS